MPQDSSSRILVQNKRSSPAGSGWNISGVQKIYNPSNSTVMLEEANGSISTYSVNNVISTVFNGEDAKYDLKNRVDLSNWPKIYLTSKDDQKNSYLTEVDMSTTATASNLKSLPIFSGELASQATFNCSTTTKCDVGGCYPYYSGNFSPNKYQFKTAFESGGWFKSGTGEFFILDKNQHSFYRQSGDLKLLGDTINVDDKFSSKVSYEGESFRFTTYLKTNQSETNIKCSQAFGQECGAPISQQGPLSCASLNLERTCTESFGLIQVVTCNTSQNPQFLYTPSVGVIGKPGSDLQKLNTPSALISNASGLVYIADTGNNRIISYNASTGQTLLVAGNGQNIDAGDGGAAITASIYHPKALALDANQNLYVASENGYIRKIDTSGIISTVAGKPIGSGGVVSDESLATEMSFSNPSGLLFDNQNNYLYVSDTNNHRVVQIDLNSGIANKVAGEGTCSALSDVGDGKPALFASLCSPTDLGFDENQNLVINDSGHKKVRRVIFSSFQSGAIAFATSTQNQSRLFKNADNTWTRQYRDSSYDYFNVDGLQVSSTNRLGQIKSFSYNAQKNLTKITFPNSQEVTYNYSFGKLESITDPAGRSTSFEYQGDNLTKVIYPDSTTQQFEYNAKSMMTKNTNQEFKSTEFTYNEWNRLQSVKKPDGSIKTFNDIASQTISNNYVTETATPMESVGFDVASASTQVKDENQTVTEMTQDHMGFISTVKDALGNITKIKRDIYGKPILLTRADDSKIEYKYSETTEDLLSVKDISTGIETKMTYNLAGNILTYTDAKNNLTQYNYNSTTGQLLSEVMPDGVIKNYEYNSQGLVSKVIITKGSESQQTLFSYNSLAQLTSITDNSGKTISFVNDLAGNQMQVITTPNGSTQHITKYEFDKFNRIISTTNSKNQKTTYEYNKIGDVLTVTGPKGLVNSYVYNDIGEVIQKTNSFGKSYFFEYDKVGNKTKETDPNNNVKTFEYDLLYRLKKAKLPDDEVNLTYDSIGNLTKASSVNSEINFDVDSIGRITKTSTRGLGELLSYPSLELNYLFDQNSNISSFSSALGNLGYSYDSQNRLTQISSSWAPDITFNFDDLERLSEINRNNNIKSEFSFDSSSNLQSITHKLSSTNIDTTTLAYNSKNQAISKQDFFSQKQYTLDENSQLTQVQNTTTPSENESFSYDENSNRLTDNENLISTYDAQAQRLLEDDKFSFTYDNNGNLITKVAKNNTETSYNFIYNSKNQLVKAQNYIASLSNLTSESEFQYDVIGRRIYKKVKDFNNLSDAAKTYARYFIYERQNILAEYNATNTELLSKYINHPQAVDNVLSASVTSSGITAKLSKSSGVFYFLKDHQGSVSAITNASGLVVQRYKYSSFGKILSITDASGVDQSSDPYLTTTQTYTGREYDAEIKLYYYRARYYDASLGRFIQEDAFAGRLSQAVSVTNRYIYVFNNPLNYVDPSGNDGSSTYNPGVGSGSGGGYTSGGGSSGGGSNPSRGEAGYWSPGSSLPPSYPGTIVVGVGFNAYLGIGYEGSVGIYAGEQEHRQKDGGVFITNGVGFGLGFGADIFFGYFFDGPSAVQGKTTNINLSYSYFGVTGILDATTNKFIGFTINIGYSGPMANLYISTTTTEVQSFLNKTNSVTPLKP
ncbi:MAG: RHS repeat-associated core domain-containing protein [Pseudobdellovibrio sp.]